MRNSSSLSAAKRLVELSARDGAEGRLTQLHVQKLLYFAEAWSLEARGQSLYPDAIEAWMYGPVVPHVYTRFRYLEVAPFTLDYVREIDDLPGEESRFVDAVWEAYRGYSSAELVDMSHGESPWAKATDNGRDVRAGNRISRESIAEAYSGRERPPAIRRFEEEIAELERQSEEWIRARKPLGDAAFAEKHWPPQSWFSEESPI